jgi:hypothetical protein
MMNPANPGTSGQAVTAHGKEEVRKMDEEKMVQLIHEHLNCYLIDDCTFDLLEKRINKCIRSFTQRKGFNAEDSETLKELMELYQFTDRGKIMEMSKRKISYLTIRFDDLFSK